MPNASGGLGKKSDFSIRCPISEPEVFGNSSYTLNKIDIIKLAEMSQSTKRI